MEEYSRTDLACESRGIASGAELSSDVYREEHHGAIKISRLNIKTLDEEKMLGKPRGTYVTVMCGKLWLLGEEMMRQLEEQLAKELRAMCEGVCGKTMDSGFSVLVVGLGNSEITVDAIGPFSVRRLNVTRHLRRLDETLYNTVGRCEISALLPGVLGQTGIETVELVRGAVDKVKPDVVVAIDALAARSCQRLAATIQLSDSGINPGSGIGNHRKAINRQTIGVPVVALGVPTVVNSSTLVYDVLEQAGISEMCPSLREILENGKSFFVSPRESDVITESVSEILANAVDGAFTLSE